MIEMILTPRTVADFQVLHEFVIPKLKSADKTGDSKTWGEVSDRYGLLARDLYLALNDPHDPICLPPYVSINRFRESTQEKCFVPEEIEFWAQGDAIIFLHKYLLEKGVFKDVPI